MAKEIRFGITDKVQDYIRRYHMIPYKVSPGNKYEKYKWYYNSYWDDFFKVDRARYDRWNKLIDATITWNGNLLGYICTDLDVGDIRFERDNELLYTKDIIETDNIYSGAEIVYWFFMNNITSSSKRYRGFWKYVDPSSSHRISDTNKYKISAKKNCNGIYINCKLTKVK